MDKVLRHQDVLDQLTSNMTIGVGGWGARRKPMSLIRAICQTDLKDLTVVSYGGPDVGLLCAHKKVKKLIFGFHPYLINFLLFDIIKELNMSLT